MKLLFEIYLDVGYEAVGRGLEPGDRLVSVTDGELERNAAARYWIGWSRVA